MQTQLNDKQRVAIHAANLIKDNMVVGLGTGSTANYFIDELARRTQEEGLTITCVSSSVISANKARESGLILTAIENISELDIYVDGADEVTPNKILLKGRGFDLVKEKLLAQAAKLFYVLIDESKLVSRIGENYPIPVEVMPFAWQLVQSSIHKLGGEAVLRKNSAGDGLAISSHGSLVLDATFSADIDASELNQWLNAIPGVVEHGIFEGLANEIVMAKDGVVIAQ